MFPSRVPPTKEPPPKSLRRHISFRKDDKVYPSETDVESPLKGRPGRTPSVNVRTQNLEVMDLYQIRIRGCE